MSAEQPIPIGQPACNAELRIEDGGELSVRGPTLFSGYWAGRRIEPAVDADGWYRTGDCVSVNAAGEFFYHGRLDRMMKCSGYRVEPAEIEAVIATVKGVVACAVVGIHDASAGTRPAAAVVGQDLNLSQVTKTLQNRLPAYMRPCRYEQVDDLPHLPNGKVDYAAIRRLLQGNRS